MTAARSPTMTTSASGPLKRCYKKNSGTLEKSGVAWLTVPRLRQPALGQIGQHAAHDAADLVRVDALVSHRAAAHRLVGKTFFCQQAGQRAGDRFHLEL